MKTCLIVDDSRLVRRTARKMLENMGFDCSEAEDGDAACHLCRTRMPDIILLDWNMPVMSGIEFLHVLRAMNDGARPRVIFCTTENGLPKIEEALEAGADEYIMKPFDSDILQGKLQQVGSF